MADPAHHHRTRTAGQIEQGGIAGFPIDSRQANLDQFMVAQGAFGLADDAWRDPRIAHQDDGFEGVGEATKMPALLVIELHAPIVNLR